MSSFTVSGSTDQRITDYTAKVGWNLARY